MSIKRLAGLAVVIFILWLAIERPVEAGHLTHNVGAFLALASSGLALFARSL
jgi:hypothetical protein